MDHLEVVGNKLGTLRRRNRRRTGNLQETIACYCQKGQLQYETSHYIRKFQVEQSHSLPIYF